MKNKLNQLNLYIKVSLIVLIFIIASLVCTFCLLKTNYYPLPLITFFGLFIGCFGSFILSLIDKKSQKMSGKLAIALSLIVVILRFVFLAIAVILSAVILQHLEINIVYLLLTVGGYLLSTLLFVIFAFKEGKRNGTR